MTQGVYLFLPVSMPVLIKKRIHSMNIHRRCCEGSIDVVALPSNLICCRLSAFLGYPSRFVKELFIVSGTMVPLKVV